MRIVCLTFLFLFFPLIPPFASAQDYQLTSQYWKEADQLSRQGEYRKAAAKFAQAVEAEEASPAPRLSIISELLNDAGYFYIIAGDYNKPVKYLQKALTINKKLGNQKKIATNLNNLGGTYKRLHQYRKALDYYEQSLAIMNTLEGQEGSIADCLNNIGTVYNALRDHDKAQEYFQRTLVLDRKLRRTANIARDLNNLGVIYDAQGHYNKAINHYQQAYAVDKELQNDADISSDLKNIAKIYQTWKQHESAINYFQQALAIDRKLGREADAALLLNIIGGEYRALGKYDKALDYYLQALAIDKKLGRAVDFSRNLNNIAGIYSVRGEHDKAISYFQQALTIDKKLGNKIDIARDLNNTGALLTSLGQYDKAVEFHQQALDIFTKLGRESNVAISLNNVGTLYESWGKFDTAIEYFARALVISEKLGIEENSASYLNNIGSVYRTLKQYEKAIDYFQKASLIEAKLRIPDATTSLNNIGMVYEARGNHEKALEYYQQALINARELGKETAIALSLNNMGGAFGRSGQYGKAIEHFQMALKINTKSGEAAEVARDLNNIGVIYKALSQFDRAIEYFTRSVELIEKLRLTASGDVRRDYLERQIDRYRLLASSYINNNDPSGAFSTIELSHSKLLAERLAETEKQIARPSVEDIRTHLPSDTAILAYSNVAWEKMVQIVLTRSVIHGQEISRKPFTTSAIKRYGEPINDFVKSLRGVKVVKKKDLLITEEEYSEEFENIFRYYRSLLIYPSPKNSRGVIIVPRERRKAASSLFKLGRELHDLLIEPIKEHIKDKKNLIIVPDGILAIIPFETLIDKDGKYLVEKYNISYTQSMGVLEQVRQRTYAETRKPMLAFGGAVYDEATFSVGTVQNERELAFLQNALFRSFKDQKPIRSAYGALEIPPLTNLPGTLAEVNAIGKIVEGSTVITGESVDEGEIKALSRQGELAQYKTLHFATHAIAVPEIPELSAVVLSQFNQLRNGEDGYLRMGEVAQLDIQADFVNLSACDTGLGKIYNGEGVVGLAQSFLVAGANALSVSLWQVSDDSAFQFMTGMYAHAKEKEMSYLRSMNDIKRQFIKGKFGQTYKAPYYWAPFIYYGNPNE